MNTRRTTLALLVVLLSSACAFGGEGPAFDRVFAVVDSITVTPEPFTTASVNVSVHGGFEPSQCAQVPGAGVENRGDTVFINLFAAPGGECTGAGSRYEFRTRVLTSPPRRVTIVANGQQARPTRVIRSFQLPLPDSPGAVTQTATPD